MAQKSGDGTGRALQIRIWVGSKDDLTEGSTLVGGKTVFRPS
jgi:hypothetical protein